MSQSIDTIALHAGALRIAQSVATPVFHSSTYEMEEGVAYRDIRYARLGNSPNHEVLHARLAKLCGAEAAVTCGSGMAAIYTAIDEVVPTGGKLLTASTLYGGTAGLIARWRESGRVITEQFDASSAEYGGDGDVDAIYVETVANPTIVPTNLPAVVELGERLGAPVIVDNTFGSPVVCRPIDHGADIVVHSATKYLNGHSDVTAGVIAGPLEVMERIRTRLAYNGAMLDPGAAYLLERGMKTLGVRVRRQCESAGILAQRLRELGTIEVVHYPNSGDFPWLQSGGAMLSFELPEEVEPEPFFRALQYFVYAPSLGGVESLIIRPAFGSHAGMSPAERARMGVSDRLVRVSVGLEEPDDLFEDLARALRAGGA